MSEEITAPDTSTSTPGAEDGSQGSGQATTQPENTEGQPQNASVAGTTPAEETFFDPKTVPEALMPAYKQMQAAFTKKTQEIATFKKDADSWKTKAEAYGKYEKYAPILEEMLSGQGAPQDSPEMAVLEKQLRDKGYSDEAIELIKMGATFTLNTFNQQRQTEQETAKAGEFKTWATSKIEEAGKLDSRLTDQNLVYQIDNEKLTFGQIVENQVMADPNWMKNPVAATQRAIKIVDALIGKAKTEGKEELSASATSKANRFPNVRSSPQTAVGSSKPLTIHEAAKEAKKELGI